jgi:hypothetical protein
MACLQNVFELSVDNDPSPYGIRICTVSESDRFDAAGLDELDQAMTAVNAVIKHRNHAELVLQI